MSESATVVASAPRWSVQAYWGIVAAGGAWSLWAIDFNVLAISDGDADRQYRIVQRIFGEDVDAQAYHFGLALVEAPFFALGRLISAAGIETVGGVEAEQAAVAVGGSLVVLATIILCAWLLSRLELPHRGAAVGLAVFGMPLFYYGSLNPARTHAWDTLLFVVVLLLLLAYLRTRMESVPLVLAMAAVSGLAATVRYFNAPTVVALVLGLMILRRTRHALLLGAVSVAVAGLLALVPLAAGLPFSSGIGGGTRGLGYDPLVPFKMLFTDQRGLFVWSPVALLGAVGFILLLRRRSPDRAFFGIAGGMAVAVMVAYGAHVEAWDGRWSFSQRFFTPFVPLVAIGLCALAARRRWLTVSLASVATAWTLYLALTLHTVGAPNDDYDRLDSGASELALQPVKRGIGPGAYAWGVQKVSRFVP